MGLTFALMLALQGATPTVVQRPYSDCILTEISRLERVERDKLQSFARKNADRAFKICQPIKRDWQSALTRKLATDPAFASDGLRKAEVNRIISEDELTMLLLVQLRSR